MEIVNFDILKVASEIVSKGMEIILLEKETEIKERPSEWISLFKKLGIEKYSKLEKTITEKLQTSMAPQFIQFLVSSDEAYEIFAANGKNAEDAPQGQIFRQAKSLVLYALTLGPKVSDLAGDMMQSGEYLNGYLLDSFASWIITKIIERLETEYATLFQAMIKGPEDNSDLIRVLSYSPGYCGWNIAAQRTIFDFIFNRLVNTKNEQYWQELGIGLSDTFLMTPIKSTTGILVVADKHTHHLALGSKFSFCTQCQNKNCGKRFSFVAKALDLVQK